MLFYRYFVLRSQVTIPNMQYSWYDLRETDRSVYLRRRNWLDIYYNIYIYIYVSNTYSKCVFGNIPRVKKYNNRVLTIQICNIISNHIILLVFLASRQSPADRRPPYLMNYNKLYFNIYIIYIYNVYTYSIFFSLYFDFTY